MKLVLFIRNLLAIYKTNWRLLWLLEKKRRYSTLNKRAIEMGFWCLVLLEHCFFYYHYNLQASTWLSILRTINLAFVWATLGLVSLTPCPHRWQCLRWRRPSECVWPSLQTCTAPAAAEQCGPARTQRWWSQCSRCRALRRLRSPAPAHRRKEMHGVKEHISILKHKELQLNLHSHLFKLHMKTLCYLENSKKPEAE